MLGFYYVISIVLMVSGIFILMGEYADYLDLCFGCVLILCGMLALLVCVIANVFVVLTT